MAHLRRGFIEGIAYSHQENKALRQATLSSSALGKIVTDHLNEDITDSMSVDTVADKIYRAFFSSMPANILTSSSYSGLGVTDAGQPYLVSREDGSKIPFPVTTSNTDYPDIGIVHISIIQKEGEFGNQEKFVRVITPDGGLVDLVEDGWVYKHYLTSVSLQRIDIASTTGGEAIYSGRRDDLDENNAVEHPFYFPTSYGLGSGDTPYIQTGWSAGGNAPFLKRLNGTIDFLATQDYANTHIQSAVSDLHTQVQSEISDLRNTVQNHYVDGQGGGGNVGIKNIQMVNAPEADNSGAYLQVLSANNHLFAIPTNGNVAHQISEYVTKNSQPPGNYVTAETYKKDFDSGDNRVNIGAYNQQIVFEALSFPYTNNNTYTFARPFSSPPVVTLTAFDDVRGCHPQLIEVTADHVKFGLYDNNHNYYPDTHIMVHIIAVGKH
ncbi:hypothetical protein [Entomobacter blattae]|uniref:Tail fiber protein n=1 Tax=Entomobacter blattae TaxID=2762277 RepID=A0A7H1NTR7_9PROT|nr:hypothetical protein [Entomobacter blattae]QNT79177.1 hypothetical protein JGUZn3_19720 [Entomobacter blattae]